MTDVLTPVIPATDKLAGQFALLSDPLRLEIVTALAAEQMCTCHLVDVTGAKQSTVSHHLRVLREAGVVEGQAQGRFTWYRLVPNALTALVGALTALSDSGERPRLREGCETKE